MSLSYLEFSEESPLCQNVVQKRQSVYIFRKVFLAQSGSDNHLLCPISLISSGELSDLATESCKHGGADRQTDCVCSREKKWVLVIMVV